MQDRDKPSFINYYTLHLCSLSIWTLQISKGLQISELVLKARDERARASQVCLFSSENAWSRIFTQQSHRSYKSEQKLSHNDWQFTHALVALKYHLDPSSSFESIFRQRWTIFYLPYLQWQETQKICLKAFQQIKPQIKRSQNGLTQTRLSSFLDMPLNPAVGFEALSSLELSALKNRDQCYFVFAHWKSHP